MKHIHTRFLSLILAVVIILACFSSVPAYSVNAATNDIPEDAASYNGHRYKLYNDADTWQKAEEKCEQRGGHLATFSSKEENDFVYSYIKSQNVKSAYFGFTDSATEGTWTWVTGESVVYTNWSSGEPNGENPKEDYAMFYYKFQDGKWNDGDFGGITVNGGKYYICEWDGNVPDKENFSCLSDLECVDEGYYTGNMGDARVYKLDATPFNGYHPLGYHNQTSGNGNIGVDGTVYENGFEVWIARWNFGDNISWAYRTFKLGGNYHTLTGSSGIIKSYNTTNYDVTAYFYSGDDLLYSFQMTPSSNQLDFSIDVSGVNELKVLVQDNIKTSGGTSYALYNLFLDGSSIDHYTKENFNEFFARNKLQNIHELCDYESIGYAILQSSSSFQINWNTCIQAFCNKDFIDLSKLKFQPQYYYETVLLQSIAKTKLNDDYLEALASEAKNLLIDAADVFLTLDSDFNSYDDLYETKLNEATDLFGGTSPEVHKLYKAYGKYTSAENFYDDVKFVYDSYKEINGTCGDFLTALNNYEISQSVSAELILALEYVRDSIQTEASKENQYLVKAIDEVLKQTRQSRDASMKDFIGKTAKEQVLGFVISVAKDIVSPIATGFDLESVGADTVITISDTLFPTSMSSDSCCKIYADYAFEYVYQEALNRALSSNDESKAPIVVGLYDLLSNTYMHEIEVAKILASQIYKDGLINCLRNLFSYKSDYKYVTECIQAYKADLYAITKERTAALTEYGFAVGLQQPITVVCYQNGKVIYYHETSVPTGTCYKPEVDTERFAQMLGMNVDINAFYTDSALTIMYDSTRSVNAPLTLFCNVSLSARNSSEKQMVDYSTGIVVANHSEADSTMLRTQQMLSGSTYDSISSNLGTENFSLYDITMTRQNSPIQPSTQVQVKIPLLINDAQKVGKVYRVENGQFSDMKSYIEDDYYCFNTTHFSEYVVSLIPITSKEESCENDPNRCPSIIFTDAPSYGNWAHAGIDYCVSHGLMNGVGKGQFDPNGTLTRAMLVTVLYRVQGEPDVSGLENPFEDVPDGMWYTEPIIWAASKQVVNGTSASIFEPDAPITREQIAAILYRYAKEVEGADVSASAALDGFADAASVSAYARTPLGWASALGYIKGSNENGTLLLNPQGNATRAEVATILMRYLER